MRHRAETSTLRLQLEPELAASQLAAIVEASDDAIMSATLDETLTAWNPGAERLFGYAPHEMLGKSVSLLAPPDRSDAVPQFNKRISRGGRFHHHETEFVGKDGRRLKIRLSILPIRNGAGRVAGAALIARDIAERDKTESSRFKSEMVTWICHEFNNSLTMLITSSHVLKRGERGKLAKDRRCTYDVIDRTLNRLKKNVANWLDSARLESGSLIINVCKTPINELLKESIKMLRPLAQHKKIGMRLSSLAAAKTGAIKADADAVSLVIANLISNAIKYTPAGGHITVGVRPVNGSMLRISVKDSGIGIKTKEIPLILSGQRTADGMRTASGLGLGLKICQELLSHHGSRLSVESSPGGGSRFSFALPLWRGRATRRAAARRQETP